MICTYITRAYDYKSHKLFLSRLGERAGISPEEMLYIELTDLCPVSEMVWKVVSSEENVIIDLTQINMEILIVLYARYLKWPDRTFLLLSEKLENEFMWGYGAGIYGRLEGSEINEYQLARLQRDIAFYFSQRGTGPIEPVRELLEKYWNTELVKRLECDTDEIDFDKIEIQEKNTGEEITRRLKQCLAQNDLKNFQNELRNIVYNKYIDPMDYIIIGRLCCKAGFPTSRVAVLERGNKVWKENNQPLVFGLIDAYIDSPNKEHREKAVKLVEKYFHIEYDEDGKLIWNVEDIEGIVTQNYIKSLFNAYISLDQYDRLYALVKYEDLIIKKSKDNGMHLLFLRNKAVSLGESGEYLQALKLYVELMEEEPSESTLNLMVEVCERADIVILMFKLLVVLICTNYGDMKYMIRMADAMAGNSVIYSADFGWRKVGQLVQVVEKQVVPLLMYIFSFEENQNRRALIYDVDRLLEKVGSKSERYFLHKKDKIAYLWNDFKKDNQDKYDFTLVNYLINQHLVLDDNELKTEEYLNEILKEIK